MKRIGLLVLAMLLIGSVAMAKPKLSSLAGVLVVKSLSSGTVKDLIVGSERENLPVSITENGLRHGVDNPNQNDVNVIRLDVEHDGHGGATAYLEYTLDNKYLVSESFVTDDLKTWKSVSENVSVLE